MTANPSRTAIGIDLGGTDIKGGLVNERGEILRDEVIATEAEGGPDHVLARISELVATLQDHARVAGSEPVGMGIGSPGTLSSDRRVVVAPPNLPGWRNVPVVERLERASGMRVLLENDANIAAWGEFVAGAGRGSRSMVLLTLGTGVGGGIILDGRLWRGARSGAGELGHMIVHSEGRLCGCGQRGCLEAYASATNTVARFCERVNEGLPSSLAAGIIRGKMPNAHDILNAARSGDGLSRSIWDETCRYLAVGCVNIRNVLDPDCILLAGGMSAAGGDLLAPTQEACAKAASTLLGPPPDIRLAGLGNSAGFVGAALSLFVES